MKRLKQILAALTVIFLIVGCTSSNDSTGTTTTGTTTTGTTTTGTTTTTVTDADGNTYATVTICDQTWTKTNLNVTKYKNGDVIPQVTDRTAWAALTTGAWCYFNNDPGNGAVYGKLYNWYAVHDPRGLAPKGYHVPTDAEWTTLTTCLGGESVAGGKMKEIGTTHWAGPWAGPNVAATNSSGFTGLPGGFRSSIGTYVNIGYDGNWWSSSEDDTADAWNRNLIFNYGSADRGLNSKSNGFSVRCLRD